MSKTEFTASANVRITIEVQNLGPYGEDWKTSEIHKQVSQEAINALRRLVGPCPNCKEKTHGRFAIVGEPEVTIVSQRKVKP